MTNQNQGAETARETKMEKLKNMLKKTKWLLLVVALIGVGALAHYQEWLPDFSSETATIDDDKGKGVADTETTDSSKPEETVDDDKPKDTTDGNKPEEEVKVAELPMLEDEVKLKTSFFENSDLPPAKLADRIVGNISSNLEEQIKDGTFADPNRPNRFIYTFNWSNAKELLGDDLNKVDQLAGMRLPKIQLRRHLALTPTNGLDFEIIDYGSDVDDSKQFMLVLDYSSTGGDIEGPFIGVARVPAVPTGPTD